MKIKTMKVVVAVSLLLVGLAHIQATPVEFQVNMDYQINWSGGFIPADDTVEVRGAWDGWANGVTLVNNGSNIYTNTVDITGFSPGTVIQYKFHAYGDYDNWENIPGYIYTNGGNRAFLFTGSALALAPVYFSDQWQNTTPLKFQVDMGPQMLAGNFLPESDTVEVRGSWDGFSSGIALTNDPAGLNPNLYSMTFPSQSPAPGGLMAYKFHMYGSHDIYELDPNRLALVTQPATVLPPVYFSDLETNDLLPTATTVTFTVNMANAVDVNGVPFDPANDQVFIGGDFTYPVWTIDWQDPLIFDDYSQYLLQPGPYPSTDYSITIPLPAGNPVRVQYKYGIYHDAGSLNYNADNEADFELNHTRYIRTIGTYNFPTDIFGQQQTNLAAATEISFGNLQIAQLGRSTNQITWLGRPGVHLQMATNVTDVWLDRWDTDGLEVTNLPVTSKTGFYRLVKP